MRRRRVAVLYSHPLFGCGIAQLLSRDEQFDVACLESGDAAESALAMTPGTDAIVVEDGTEPDTIDRVIQALPPVLVVVVSLQDNGLKVYQGRRRLHPHSEDLPDLIHEVLAVSAGHAPATPVATTESVVQRAVG